MVCPIVASEESAGRWGLGNVDTVLAGLFELIAPHLTARQRGLLAGAGAKALGHGDGARIADEARPGKLRCSPDRSLASATEPSTWRSTVVGELQKRSSAQR
jgi:hypothetical protein